MPALHKKIIVLLLLVLIAGTAAARIFLFKPEFHYAGTIEATKVDIPSRIGSVIADQPVREGDRVQTGQVLLNLSGEEYRLAAALAAENYNRAAQLFKDGSLSQQDYDSIKNKKDTAELIVSWCTVTSPLSGTVLAKYHEPGEMVVPGTKLFTIADLTKSYAYIYVPQPAVAGLRLQQPVTGRLPEMPGRIFPGCITRIADEAEFTPKNVQTEAERTRLVFAVKITFENAAEILKPGMSIEVDLPEEKQSTHE